MDLSSLFAVPAVVIGGVTVCFLAAMPVCMYIAKKRGADGLRAFADVVRAFWGRKR